MSGEAETQRERIRALLKRVPPGVNAGSYNTTANFKHAVIAAREVLASGTNDVGKLVQARVQLEVFYG